MFQFRSVYLNTNWNLRLEAKNIINAIWSDYERDHPSLYCNNMEGYCIIKYAIDFSGVAEVGGL